MKKVLIILSFCCMSQVSFSQAQEIQQLLLNWEKLTQFKKILQDMYDGWKVINQGYNTIKDISSDNFSLHKGFLDALMEVIPVVKKYKRITDIVNYQLQIVKQYKLAFQQFKDGGTFTQQEIDYIGKVYSNLFNESVKNLDELFMVITAGQLRMSDDERMQAIDRIYARIEEQFSFLQDFNSSTGYLSLQRKAEQTEINMSKKILGY
ncbi:MAG TPA: TerB family tellurite resistance protein [Chitinophagaceae bacterium]|nr:TerB family tellurite resistance protein [Chitinophagaceae bacterium]